MKKNNSGEIVVAILVGLAVAGAGLLMTVSKHNTIVASGNAERVYVGVKAPIGPGVAQAVSNNKGEALLSILAGVAAGVATDALNKDDRKDDENTGARVSVSGNGNTVTYNDRGIQDRHDATYAPAPAATAEE